MSAEPRTQYHIGPSGWSYDDWDGVVYPRPRPRGFKPLATIARLFNAVEVNTSFYRIPMARMTAAWPAQVSADFRFAFKLTQTFTHERAGFPGRSDISAFQRGLEPIRDAGLLGPLLIQFPWSFRFDAAAVERLARLRDAFTEHDRFIEVRHRSWATPEAMASLRAAGGYCNIDQPVLRDCLGPTAHVFGRHAYVRLHGRNARHWFATDQPGYERYNYLYSETEIGEWVERIRALAADAEAVYVFANNHYRGQAVANGLELQALLSGRKVVAPTELRDAFPRLRPLTLAPPPTNLFELG